MYITIKKKKKNNTLVCTSPHTFLRPSSSSSVRGHGWSFSSGLTKGEACFVSGLKLGDKITLAGTAPPCELMDNSERWGLPVREPVWGWEVLKKKKKVISLGPDFYLQFLSFQIFRTWLPHGKLTELHYFLFFFFLSCSHFNTEDTIVWIIQWNLSYVINDKAGNSAEKIITIV